MTDRTVLSDIARRAATPVLSLVLISYFLFHAVAGNTGLLALREYRGQHDLLAMHVHDLAARRMALERQNALLDPRHVNPDYADELVRNNLAVIASDEVIVDLPPPAPAAR